MRSVRSMLVPAIVALALVAGLIHLDLVLMMVLGPHGGPPSGAGGPPPGALPSGASGHGPDGPPGGGPGLFMFLPYLFALNFLGFTALAALFLLLRRAAIRYQALVDALLGLMAVATLIGWNSFGRPQFNGLGFLALIVELALIVAVIAHGFSLRQLAMPEIDQLTGQNRNVISDAPANGRRAGRTPPRRG